MNRPFLLAGFLGLVALLFASTVNLPLRGISFDSPPPFTHPVIAIELGTSSATMEVVLGPEAGRSDKVSALLAATNRDTLFVLAYTLFLLAFAATVWRQTRRLVHLLLVLLALGIGFADIAENTAIKSLLLTYVSDMYEAGGSDFRRVLLFAWAKWAGLAVYFAVLVPYLWARGWVIGRGLALVAAVAAVLGLLAGFSPIWIERYVAAVFMALPLTVAYCFLAKTVTAPASPPAG